MLISHRTSFLRVLPTISGRSIQRHHPLAPSQHFSTTIAQYRVRAMTTSPSAIPTLANLYTSREIPLPEDRPQYQYDEELNKRVSIWRGDITKLQADIIVNAANKSLLGGGGVDGAIHSAAGRKLLEECRTLGGADTGETKTTMGYELPAKRVAHTVGPIYSRRDPSSSQESLTSCYQTSLDECVKYGGGAIGFSSISTGIYGYPIVDATHVALETTRKYLERKESDPITRVIFVVFSARDEKVYRGVIPHYFPPPPGYQPREGDE